jgi:hypothetical protein
MHQHRVDMCEIDHEGLRSRLTAAACCIAYLLSPYWNTRSS